jgi:phosphomannomutase
MVTASHNPPQDNGYKVYLSDGAQIVPPADADISAAIDAVGPLRDLPLGDDWETLDEEVLESYITRASGVVGLESARDLHVVYTPLHGTGWDVVRAAFTRAGFPEPLAVKEQAEPDPDFPTVAFPNPEEPGAMDLACALAEQSGADLIIANDPDADRCAVGVPAPAQVPGVAHAARRRGGRAHRDAPRRHPAWPDRNLRHHDRVVLAAGQDRGCPWAGVRRNTHRLQVALPGPDLVYSYEEALGYCVDPAAVRDKDGISAAWWSPSWRPASRPPAAPSTTCSTRSRADTACTKQTAVPSRLRPQRDR